MRSAICTEARSARSDRRQGVALGARGPWRRDRATSDGRERPAQVVRGGRGEAHQWTQPAAVLGDLPEDEQHTGAAVDTLAGQHGTGHSQHEVVAGGRGSCMSPTPSSAREAPGVAVQGIHHQAPPGHEGDASEHPA